MSFTVSKSGYYLYTPSWQKNPGARMKAMNRQAVQTYYDTTATLGGNLLSGTTNATAGSVELAMKMATERVQKDFEAKVTAAQSRFSMLA